MCIRILPSVELLMEAFLLITFYVHFSRLRTNGNANEFLKALICIIDLVRYNKSLCPIKSITIMRELCLVLVGGAEY